MARQVFSGVDLWSYGTLSSSSNPSKPNRSKNPRFLSMGSELFFVVRLKGLCWCWIDLKERIQRWYFLAFFVCLMQLHNDIVSASTRHAFSSICEWWNGIKWEQKGKNKKAITNGERKAEDDKLNKLWWAVCWRISSNSPDENNQFHMCSGSIP